MSNTKRANSAQKVILLLMLVFLGCSSNDNGPDINNSDTIAPTQPTNLVASQITQNSMNLSWGASTDNIGVANYSIYRDGNILTSIQLTNYVANGLSPETSYEFKIKAKDAAGNESAFSNAVTAMTLADVSTLQMASGDLEVYVNAIVDNAPDSSGDDYSEPNSSQLTAWDVAVTSILQDDITNAVTKVGEVGYQITEFTDTTLSPNQVFYVLEKKTSESNYWGTYVFSKTPERANLIIMAPHSKYDTNTGKEAVFSFKDNLAKVLFLNGTHRCNSSQLSSCSGTTSACGSSDAFRLSDMAHTTTSMFQKTTENVFTNDPNSVFVQLHGFSKQATDPYVIMSNGTRETPVTDYATLIMNALIVEDNTLTFKLAHIDTTWTRLIGFTNSQGRLINSSNNHCTESAITTSGRFIHIEQEKTKLRDDIAGWTKMSNALKSVF